MQLRRDGAFIAADTLIRDKDCKGTTTTTTYSAFFSYSISSVLTIHTSRSPSDILSEDLGLVIYENLKSN